MIDNPNVKIIDEKIVYHGFLTLKKLSLQHRLFAGGMSAPLSRELLMRHLVSAVLPYDPDLDRVVLLEQFRIGALTDSQGPWQLELVAGILDTNETLEALALRETKEEAGLDVIELMPIYQYWVSPGGTDERVMLFCAKVDAAEAGGVYGILAENEDILVLTMPSEEAFAAVNSGRINNAATIIALQWLQLNREKIRQRWGKSSFLP